MAIAMAVGIWLVSQMAFAIEGGVVDAASGKVGYL